MIFFDVLSQLIAAWVFAELVGGIVHWFEDRYCDPAWPIIGPHVVQPNIEHHTIPRAFTKRGYFVRNWTTLVPSLVAAACSVRTPWLCGGFLLLSQGNEIHAWAHQRCSAPIRWLQRLGVLQSPQHHAEHHTAPFSRRYCVMSNYLNPALEAIGFWASLEWGVWLVSGVRPRPERAAA